MALTPVEIRHIRLGRGFRGYKRHSVDTLLVEVAESFEDVWRERADLADKVETLESDLQRHKELEGLLRTTLVSAERSAHEQKDQARREAGLIVEEAHAEARAIARRATRPRRSGSRPSCAGSSRCSARRSTASTSRRRSTSALRRRADRRDPRAARDRGDPPARLSFGRAAAPLDDYRLRLRVVSRRVSRRAPPRRRRPAR